MSVYTCAAVHVGLASHASSKIDRATASGTTAFTMNLIGLNSTDMRPSFLKPTSLAARALAPSSPADIAKYVGIAIGAVFFLALISSVFAVYRRRRRYARKRPRGSIYIETTQPSSGQPEASAKALNGSAPHAESPEQLIRS
ncbi:hypothetical protein B0H13DRAFT_2670198 [Mycena leptocephala]|nr:hypothetical protein B0H13DRAFT_2670198 [Mycena leptocephala]